MREPCNSPECQGKKESVEIFHDADGKTRRWCFRCKEITQEKSLFKREEKKRHEFEVPKKVLANHELIIGKRREFIYKYHLPISSPHYFWSCEYDRIVFPGTHSNYAWMRSIDPEVKPKMLYAGKKEDQTLYYLRHSPQTAKLVIVEDIISCLRVHEFTDSIALCGTSLSKEKKEELLRILAGYDELILWLDGDQAGKTGAQKLRKELKALIPVRIIWTPRDPKLYLPNEIQELLSDRIINPEGIRRA